jgi:signal transduction histidine kinase/tetratricopeptide (TPR) repeat protein
MHNDITIDALHKKIDRLNQEAWDVRVKDSPRAFELAKETVALSREINYREGLAHGLQSLGFCYVRLSKNQEALPLLEESLALFESLGNILGQSCAYEYMGIIQRSWGNFGESLQLAFKALELAEQTGSLENQSTIHYQVGVTYKHLGNVEKALEELYQCLSMCRDNKLLESYSINIIGSIYFESGDYTRALEYFRQGLAGRLESNDKLGEAGSLDNIGYTCLKLRDYGQAIDYCSRSLDISKTTGDTRGQANALLHLAEIYKEQGDISKAAAYSDESLTLRKASGDKRGETEIRLFLAGLYNTMPGNREKIKESLLVALGIAEEIKALDQLSKIRYSLYEYYKQQEDFIEANKNLELHLLLEKEFHKNNVDQQLKHLEISHKAEEAKKETEAIRQRNEELTKLNREIREQKNKLEEQNRELEIESSLERVRAMAMGMKRPDDILDICKVMFTELQLLGFSDLRNTLINFWDDASSTLIDYDYSDYAKGNKARLSYDSHPIFEQFQKAIKNSTDAFAKLVVEKEQLESWKQRRRASGEYEDPRLNGIDALYYYFYSIGVGSIGISTFSRITEEKLAILKRFRNVFDFAYRRYMDVAEAEGQAKEARIEASLERMRAAAMGMHRSEDLIAVCEAMYKELTTLGFSNIRNAQISIRNGDDGSYFVAEYSDFVSLAVKEAPVDNSPLLKKIYDEMQRSKDAFFQAEFKGRQFEDWREWRIKASKEQDPRIFSASSMWFHLYSLGTGYIGISTFDQITAEQTQTLKRFRNVFELAYRRYTDVSTAEAQAKEAQVQLALERVRARTMAMQKSDELLETSQELFNQLKELGENPDQITIGIIREEEAVAEVSATLKGTKLLHTFRHRLDEPFVMNKMWKAWKTKQKTFVLEQDWKELNAYNQYRNELVGAETFPVNLQQGERRLLYVAFFSKGTLALSSNEPRSEETIQLLQRFAAVFDQTYTRFLDLQKAEAQAREAAIEVSLERVRGRAMAMQTSEELGALIGTVFTELTRLDLALTRCVLWIFDPVTHATKWWMANSEDPSNPDNYYIKYQESGPYRAFVEEWKKKTVKWVYDLKGEDKKEWDRVLFKETELSLLPEVVKNGMMAPERVLLSASFNNFGAVNVASLEPLSEEHFNILLRFAKVFDLSYTRFNDIKQAEAQAREAKIELALERVRARTMAMQRSDELQEIVTIVFERLKDLDIRTDSASVIVLSSLADEMEFWVAVPGQQYSTNFHIPYFARTTVARDFTEALKNGRNFIKSYTGKEKDEQWDYLFEHTDLKDIPEDRKKMLRETSAYTVSVAFAKNAALQLLRYDEEIFTETDNAIFQRFANVFDQAYIRFLDLKKAEAQAREAKIEAALERTRTQSMIMQHSNELDVALRVFHEQVLLLGIPSAFSFLWLPDEEKERHIFWAAWKENENDAAVFKSKAINYPLNRKEPATAQCLLDWKSGNSVYSYAVPPEGVANYFAAWQELFAGAEQLKAEHFRNGLHYIEAFMKHGCFGVMVANDLAEEEKKVLGRFAVEFERTYTRFLDLQKAETQTLEAQIEAALERVRAKAMAMHKSDDLAMAVAAVFEELERLNLGIMRCGIGIISKENRAVDFWATSVSDGDKAVQVAGNESIDKHPLLHEAFSAWMDREDFSYILEGKELADYYKLMAGFAVPLPSSQLVVSTEGSAKQYYHTAIFEQGGLFAFRETEFPAEAKTVMKRFANVFNLTYKRFLDLQKAEAQVREVQIEAALERVRSKAMAMHNSQDVSAATAVMFDELTKLGVESMRCGIGILHKDSNAMDVWTATVTPEGHAIKGGGAIDLSRHQLWSVMYDNWIAGDETFVYYLKGDDLENYYNVLRATPNYSASYISETPPEHYCYATYFEDGIIFTFNYSLYSEEQKQILKRFASVFSLTYKRFKDLQKAEAQAKEAKIEASLERVRSKAMAMQKSDDLANAVAIVFEELDKLNLGIMRCGIGILHKETRCANVWTTTKSDNGTVVQVSGDESMDIHPLLQGAFEAWVNQETENSYTLKGKDLHNYYKALIDARFLLPESESLVSGDGTDEQYYYSALFSAGGLFAFRETEFPEEAKIVLKRFADVFNLTYTRFLDIQKAEEQAKEAHIETALERVRSRTLAMHKSDELSETAAELFRQLIGLGIEPNRLYIGIVNEETRDMEMWATDEDGTGIGKKFSFNARDNESVGKLYQGWKEKQRSVIVDMQGTELEEYMEYLKKLGIPVSYGIMQKRRVQTVAYFSKGFIGMASPDGQGEETTVLLERFAAVFNLTFTRFNDLKLAEAHALQAEQDLAAIKEAKQKAEEALSELQSTQRQLIQSEKMASLGELTAGIAHEIQNPLNFVNNFSEVSKELIEEMLAEAEKGNTEEVKAIVGDLVQNLEKINFHGKRADGIVKGMLQHSRTSSGQKEITDINALADEYLRLSYHGLRAKDKSFNAKFETNFDENIGKINVISQDLGRVILNLINNAFYTVSEKKKQGVQGYQPTVIVTTRSINPGSGGQGMVEIRIKDNGTGIPQKALDKIFQPFFTTKPTGQGTGLGLSLSYDIITKGHGGELNVETKEGTGSTFTILLPEK